MHPIRTRWRVGLIGESFGGCSWVILCVRQNLDFPAREGSGWHHAVCVGRFTVEHDVSGLQLLRERPRSVIEPARFMHAAHGSEFPCGVHTHSRLEFSDIVSRQRRCRTRRGWTIRLQWCVGVFWYHRVGSFGGVFSSADAIADALVNSEGDCVFAFEV